MSTNPIDTLSYLIIHCLRDVMNLMTNYPNILLFIVIRETENRVSSTFKTCVFLTSVLKIRC